jgi:hypothetical protein
MSCDTVEESLSRNLADLLEPSRKPRRAAADRPGLQPVAGERPTKGTPKILFVSFSKAFLKAFCLSPPGFMAANVDSNSTLASQECCRISTSPDLCRMEQPEQHAEHVPEQETRPDTQPQPATHDDAAFRSAAAALPAHPCRTQSKSSISPHAMST